LELKKQRRMIQEMAKQHALIREDERRKVLKELEQRKKQAVKEGDYDEALEIEKEIEEESNRDVSFKDPFDYTPAQRQALLEQFISDNPWYKEDQKMREYADLVAAGAGASGKYDDPEEILDFVVSE